MEKKLGRPRSEKTKHAILSAAYELLLENGFGAVTVEKLLKELELVKLLFTNGGPTKLLLL